MVTIEESVTFAIESGVFSDEQIMAHMNVTQEFINNIKDEIYDDKNS